MKSVVYNQNGPSSVLRLVEREAPAPGPGEVRVKLMHSGVNPTDWQARRGLLRPTSFDTVPNHDGSGVIDAVGEGVEGVALGDRVWVELAAFGRPLSGTAQEATTLPLARVHPLPDSVSFEVGATLGVRAITAHRALTIGEGVPRQLSPGALAGQTVVVAGGAGAVGHAAIQLASYAGATVIATARDQRKLDLALAAGASHVVDTSVPEAVERIRAIAPDGVNTIVEVAIAENLALDVAVLAQGGAIAAYANSPGEILSAELMALMNLNVRLQFLRLFAIPPAAFADAVDAVTRAAEHGAMPVGAEAGLPIHRFALGETGAAHDAVESGMVGKVLIDIRGA